MWKLIDGHKLQIGGIVYGLISIAVAAGWIDATMATVLVGLNTTWTGYAVKSAIKKTQK